MRAAKAVSLVGCVALLLTASLHCIAGPRSSAARAEFIKANPCPATGRTRGACPGWEVDHVIPLKCDGPGAPLNMQWLTIEEHKRKTAAEAKACRKH